MARTIVGILRGGASSEYDLSLKTGGAFLKELPEDTYDVRDIFIDKSGLWHSRGMPADPTRALSQIDLVLSALHGGAGEDGTVQRILDRAGVAYAGARALPASESLNKIRAREVFKDAGILIPQGIWFSLEDTGTTADMARYVFERFGPPYIVKAPREGASKGIIIAHTIVSLPDAIGDILDEYGSVLIEELVDGDDATVGLIEDFRNENLYALPPAHVITPVGSLHIEHSHYAGGLLEHHVPSNFTDAEKNALIDIARRAHSALNLSHFSRADFILTKRGPYLLEVNAIPGLYESASFPHMLESVGSSVREFAEHAIALARRH